MEREITLYIDKSVALPDNDLWQYRFEIRSETSDRVYIIAQNKRRRHWACSCPAWRVHRHCKHLAALGIPSYERPYEPRIEKG